VKNISCRCAEVSLVVIMGGDSGGMGDMSTQYLERGDEVAFVHPNK